jgi:hypothetical protein
LEQGLTALLFFIAQRFRATWIPVRVKKPRQKKSSFGVIAATLRELLNTEIDQAWQRLLGEIASVVAQSEG